MYICKYVFQAHGHWKQSKNKQKRHTNILICRDSYEQIVYVFTREPDCNK